jgi:hypothetical protein
MGEKDSEFEDDKVLDFRCSLVIVKTKVTPTKQKAFPDWNLLDVLDVKTRKCCRFNVRN